MRYSANTYAKALAEVIGGPDAKKDEAKIVKNFLALVERNGDSAHLRKILEEAARYVRAKNGIRKVTVEAARKLPPAQEKLVERFLEKNDVVERTIDPELVAGIRIIVNDELQFDGSLRGKLDTIFGHSSK